MQWSCIKVTNNRFVRTSALLGDEAMEKIRSSSVMIVGLGAVGGYALEAIARSGVGNLILVDFDTFDESNINRQILALSSTIGRKKTQVALERVKEINPDCNVIIKDMFVDENNVDDLLSSKPDFVIDAIDSIKPKCMLIKALIDKNIDFISSMGAALKTDTENIKVVKLNQTQNCSMAKCVRQNLKKLDIDISRVTCVFSDEQISLPASAITLTDKGQKNILGSLPTITAIFGLIMANYTIKQLIK